MVPKVVSFFWGSSRLSWLRYMTLYSFRKYNPDWEMRLYTSDLDARVDKTWDSEHKQDFFIYNGKDYIDKVSELDINIIPWNVSVCLTPSQRSNFFKWSLLSDIGGVYSDMDIIFIRSIDGLYDKFVKMNGDVALTHNGSYFSIGFMISSPNNVVFKEIYKNTVKEFNPKQYQGAGVIPIYKRWKNYQQMIKEFPDKVFYNIPWQKFYIFSFEERDEIFRQDHFKSLQLNSLGLHWFAGDKCAQDYNNWVTRLNYKLINNTVSSALFEVLK